MRKTYINKTSVPIEKNSSMNKKSKKENEKKVLKKEKQKCI
jgi:hypothetical protein